MFLFATLKQAEDSKVIEVYKWDETFNHSTRMEQLSPWLPDGTTIQKIYGQYFLETNDASIRIDHNDYLIKLKEIELCNEKEFNEKYLLVETMITAPLL